MNTQEKIAIMQAFVDGKQIEILQSKTNKWEEWKTEMWGEPTWNWLESEFRIKTEPKYRPFKDSNECLAEMRNHQPFGLVKNIYCKALFKMVTGIGEDEISVSSCTSTYSVFFNNYTFIDGTPFGVKEE